MVVWGGKNGFRSALADGAILDSRTWEWTLIPSFLPEGERGRFFHGATVSDTGLYIFGGESGLKDFKASVLKFDWLTDDPSQQSWTVVPTDTQPIGRKWHTQLSLPQGLLIWGGYGANETYLPTGALLRNLD